MKIRRKGNLLVKAYRIRLESSDELTGELRKLFRYLVDIALPSFDVQNLGDRKVAISIAISIKVNIIPLNSQRSILPAQFCALET